MQRDPATPEPPADADAARRYERSALWLRVLDAGLFAGATLLFLLSGASVALRDAVRGLSADASVQVALYAIAMVAAFALLTLPVAYLTDFRREQRYGLTNQSLSGWLTDQGKSFLLSIGLGTLLLEAVSWLLRTTGGWWWAWAGLGSLLLSVTLTLSGPVLLMPIFWKLDRLDDPQLTARLLETARRQHARVTGVYRMGLSAKTRRANAMVAGLGRTQRIIVADTLLQGFTPDEIAVVVAHEVAHQRHRDLWKGLAVDGARSAFGLWAVSLVLRPLAELGPLRGPADIAALPLLLLGIGLYGVVTLPLGNAYSRWRETLADRAALESTGLVGPFIAAMQRLATLNLANATPHPLVEFVFYSHPSIDRRIRLARAWPLHTTRAAGRPT